jgi:opacity protein-like surface antigen
MAETNGLNAHPGDSRADSFRSAPSPGKTGNEVYPEGSYVIAVRLIRTLGVVAACILALPSIAFAADDDARDPKEIGLYVEYTGGLTIVRNQNIHSRGYAGVNGQIETAPGWNAGIAFGARFQKYFRGEAQISYRNVEVKRMPVPTSIPPTTTDVGPTTAAGTLGLFAAMANGYVDLDFDIPFVPYLGAGIGWGALEFNAKNEGSALKVTDHASVFAWNLMGGATYRVSKAVDVSLGYRYVATTDPKYDGRVKDVGTVRLDSEYDAHEATLGLRFNF